MNATSTDLQELTARVEHALSTCSMIHMTMKGGVEQAVRAAAPEIKAVEAINWAG